MSSTITSDGLNATIASRFGARKLPTLGRRATSGGNVEYSSTPTSSDARRRARPRPRSPTASATPRAAPRAPPMARWPPGPAARHRGGTRARRARYRDGGRDPCTRYHKVLHIIWRDRRRPINLGSRYRGAVERGDLSGAVLDGRYRVIEPISEGAMGVVYRAERVKLGRIVAIKVIHDVLPNELSSRKRFESEAKAMAMLEHPNCACVIDFGVQTTGRIVVMDFVRGQTLQRHRSTGGPHPDPARRRDRAPGALRARPRARARHHPPRHQAGEHHAVAARPGSAIACKILDFGLARLTRAGSSGRS